MKKLFFVLGAITTVIILVVTIVEIAKAVNQPRCNLYKGKYFDEEIIFIEAPNDEEIISLDGAYQGTYEGIFLEWKNPGSTETQLTWFAYETPFTKVFITQLWNRDTNPEIYYWRFDKEKCRKEKVILKYTF